MDSFNLRDILYQVINLEGTRANAVLLYKPKKQNKNHMALHLWFQVEHVGGQPSPECLVDH